MSDELYYTPSTLEERIARARARRAEEERAIVAMEAKELEVAAEAERLRNKEPLEVMTGMLQKLQASLVERLERMERSVGALTTRVTALERIDTSLLMARVGALERLDNGLVTIAGTPNAIPVGVKSISIHPATHYPAPPDSFDGGQFFTSNLPWSLDGFQRFKRCTTLELTPSNDVKDFTSLGGMTALEKLTITNCQGLSDIRWISQLVNLRTVRFTGCYSLKDITPLATLRNLQEVYLRQTGVHSTECIARLKVDIS